MNVLPPLSPVHESMKGAAYNASYQFPATIKRDTSHLCSPIIQWQDDNSLIFLPYLHYHPQGPASSRSYILRSHLHLCKWVENTKFLTHKLVLMSSNANEVNGITLAFHHLKCNQKQFHRI